MICVCVLWGFLHRLAATMELSAMFPVSCLLYLFSLEDANANAVGQIEHLGLGLVIVLRVDFGNQITDLALGAEHLGIQSERDENETE
jgi:hypothetical protein